MRKKIEQWAAYYTRFEVGVTAEYFNGLKNQCNGAIRDNPNSNTKPEALVSHIAEEIVKMLRHIQADKTLIRN